MEVESLDTTETQPRTKLFISPSMIANLGKIMSSEERAMALYS